MEIRRICVLGGTGFVGRQIVHLLAEARYIVRVPTRNRERAKNLIVLPTVDVIQANIHDERELDKLIAGVDVVINLVGVRYERNLSRCARREGERSNFNDVHVELTNKIINACIRHRVPRLLHMGSLASKIDSKSAYARSKAEAENLVAKLFQDKNIQVTIFRPSVIFGPRDHFLTLFAKLLKCFPIIPLANYNARFQPIYVEDVAQAFVKSLNNVDTFNQRYDLGGPKVYTLRQIVEFIGKVTDYRCCIVNLNKPLSYLHAAIMERLPGKLLTRSDYYSMQVDSVCANPFPPVFGLEPAKMEAVAENYLVSNHPREKYQTFRHMAGRK